MSTIKIRPLLKREPEKENTIFIKKALPYIILIYALLLGWTLISIFPFYYMLIMGTKTTSEVYSFPPQFLLSQEWVKNTIYNYTTLLKTIPFWKNMWNSMYIAVMTTLLTILFSSLGGYGFAFYNFKGKNFLFAFLLITLMIPQILNIIPFFSMIRFFGWINQPRALYLTTVTNAFGVFLMRQYMESGVPDSLLDSARIDGCSEFSIYFRIVLPLCKPVIASLSMITFLQSWNNYFLPLIVLTKKDTMTIPLALYSLRGFQNVEWGVIMLGAGISVLPFILIFLFFSRWIMKGLTEGAVKG